MIAFRGLRAFFPKATTRKIKCGPCSSSCFSTTSFSEAPKRLINGIDLNYVEVGSGPHVLLCTPGTFGYIEYDFGKVLKNIDQSVFKVVVWDPPGYGKSRPPDRDFTGDYYFRDGILANKLMQDLGHTKYSALGWSIGGLTSIYMAASYPENVLKLVTIAAPGYAGKGITFASEAMADLNNWPPTILKPILEVYGRDYFQKMINEWLASQKTNETEFPQSQLDQLLRSITCPSLFMHGDEDRVVSCDHADYLLNLTPNSLKFIVPKGNHAFHILQTNVFLQKLTDFITT